MKILLLHMDGSLPNIALMRISAHHKALGDDVVLWNATPRKGVKVLEVLQQSLFLEQPERVYASLIFEKTKPAGTYLKSLRSDAIIGGTGWDVPLTLESIGITTVEQDYSIYPHFRASIGFLQRGCRLRCTWCVVPAKEGKVVEVQTVADIWRGDPYPRELLILDNDFFGQPHWQDRIAEIREGGFKVSFSQGINARMLTDETAAAIASVRYYDNKMKERRIYTAWDNRRDRDRLFRGLDALQSHGVKPRHMLVYMLISYQPGETEDDWLLRQSELRAYGALPYPMPYVRNPLTVGFQRWVIKGYDMVVPWQRFKDNNFQPYGL